MVSSVPQLYNNQLLGIGWWFGWRFMLLQKSMEYGFLKETWILSGLKNEVQLLIYLKMNISNFHCFRYHQKINNWKKQFFWNYFFSQPIKLSAWEVVLCRNTQSQYFFRFCVSWVCRKQCKIRFSMSGLLFHSCRKLTTAV